MVRLNPVVWAKGGPGLRCGLLNADNKPPVDAVAEQAIETLGRMDWNAGVRKMQGVRMV